MININKPDYYASGQIETKDFIRDKDLNFNIGNVVKYVVRAGKKDKNKLVEDLKKARNYLDFEIEHVEKKDRLKNVNSKTNVKIFNCDHVVRPVEKNSILEVKNENNLYELGYAKISVSTKFQQGDKVVYKPLSVGECVYTYKTRYNVHEMGAVVEVSDNTGGIYIFAFEKLINQEYYIKKERN